MEEQMHQQQEELE